MKKIVSLLASACFIFGSSVAMAGQDEPVVYPEQQALDDYVFGRPLQLDLSQIKQPELVAKPSIRSGNTTLAPAAPLSQVRVFAVGSSNSSWEYPAVGAQSTAHDHGGAFMAVVVLEMGYGGNAIGRMNGGVLPASALYRRDTLCFVNGNAAVPCPAGNTVAGFLNYWNVSGNQNGFFQHSNTSLNSPWNTLSTQINIQ